MHAGMHFILHLEWMTEIAASGILKIGQFFIPVKNSGELITPAVCEEQKLLCVVLVPTNIQIQQISRLEKCVTVNTVLQG